MKSERAVTLEYAENEVAPQAGIDHDANLQR